MSEPKDLSKVAVNPNEKGVHQPSVVGENKGGTSRMGRSIREMQHPNAAQGGKVKAVRQHTRVMNEMNNIQPKLGKSYNQAMADEIRKANLGGPKEPKASGADYGVKGVHTPISPGSGHSAAGIIGAGAKAGTKDSAAAAKQHKQKLGEMKAIKPNLPKSEFSKATLGMKTSDESGYSKEPVDVKPVVERDPKELALEDARNDQKATVYQAHTGHDKHGMTKYEPALEAGMSYQRLFKMQAGEPLMKPKK